MAKYPALPLWTDAFLADTMHLSAEETGCYMLLLMAAWRSPDCTLPDQDQDLARFARVSLRRWRDKIRPRLEPFFSIENAQTWTQKRLLGERKRVDENRAKKSENGKRSALKKKESASTPVAGSLQRSVNEEVSKTPTSISISRNSKNPPYPPPGGPVPAEHFDRFWKAYPTRAPATNPRAPALKKFQRLVKAGADPEAIIAGAEIYARKMAGTADRSKVRQATTFLNDRQWEDEIGAAEPSGMPSAGDSETSRLWSIWRDEQTAGRKPPLPPCAGPHQIGEGGAFAEYFRKYGQAKPGQAPYGSKGAVPDGQKPSRPPPTGRDAPGRGVRSQGNSTSRGNGPRPISALLPSV